MRRCALLAFFVLGACASEHEAAVSRTAVATDTGGLPSLDTVPILRFAAPEGPNEFSGEVGRALRLRSGRYVVADWGGAHLLMFDSAGRYLNTIGRRGSGPDEFQAPTLVQEAAGDTVIVWDPILRRMSWVDVRSGQSRALQIPIATAYGAAPIVGQVGDRILVRDERAGNGQGHETQSQSTTLFWIDRDGTPADTISRIPFGSETPGGFRILAPRLHVALLDDRIVWGHGSAWVLHALDHAGQRLDSIVVPCNRRVVTPEDRATIREEFEKRRAVDGFANDDRFNEYFPAFGPFLAGPDGSLWVSAVAAPYTLPESVTVVSSTGQLGAIALPSRFRMTYVDREYMVGIGFDDDDRAEVRVYRLRRP